MDLSQVTLQQLRYAIAVCDQQNFRAAARQCHVSQSGLSMQVRKLEELLGLVLFDRSRQPVLVTPEAEPVIAQMRTVLRETQRLGQVAAEEEEPSGRFRLGVIPTLSPTVLPLFLSTFLDRCPRVELVVEEVQTDDMIARLEADTLDAGVAATPLGVPGLHDEALGREALLAYLPPEDPLLRKKSVSQADLQGRELWVMPEGHCFRSQVLSYCRSERGVGPRRVHFESGSFQTLIHLVDQGLGATVLPALAARDLSAARRKAQLRPLVSPAPLREIGLVTARTDLRRRVNSVLAEVIRGALDRALDDAPKRAVLLSPRE